MRGRYVAYHWRLCTDYFLVPIPASLGSKKNQNEELAYKYPLAKVKRVMRYFHGTKSLKHAACTAMHAIASSTMRVAPCHRNLSIKAKFHTTICP
jgi:hypothetical protein